MIDAMHVAKVKYAVDLSIVHKATGGPECICGHFYFYLQTLEKQLCKYKQHRYPKVGPKNKCQIPNCNRNNSISICKFLLYMPQIEYKYIWAPLRQLAGGRKLKSKSNLSGTAVQKSSRFGIKSTIESGSQKSSDGDFPPLWPWWDKHFAPA